MVGMSQMPRLPADFDAAGRDVMAWSMKPAESPVIQPELLVHMSLGGRLGGAGGAGSHLAPVSSDPS
jgi:hypothetical protein